MRRPSWKELDDWKRRALRLRLGTPEEHRAYLRVGRVVDGIRAINEARQSLLAIGYRDSEVDDVLVEAFEAVSR